MKVLGRLREHLLRADQQECEGYVPHVVHTCGALLHGETLVLPKQILLTHLSTDVPEMTIAADNVDVEWIAKPRRWDIRFIRRFMVVFGASEFHLRFSDFRSAPVDSARRH